MPVRLYAAGSLAAAMTAIAAAFRTETGIAVEGTFGPSGLLRERIAAGAPAEVFASADMSHPAALAAAGRAGAVTAFAVNRLCALARPGLPVTRETLLDHMLDPAVRLGTSTPGADPSGDYAWRLFEKAESLVEGAYDVLAAKALRLAGGAESPVPPPHRNPYAWIMEQNRADIFITYCTNAALATKELPDLKIVAVPDALAVAAEYGLTAMKDARPRARRFAAFILSRTGRAILANYGFGLPPGN